MVKMTPDLFQGCTGKGHKLQQGKFQSDVRKKFFTRAVKHWKRDQSSCGLSIMRGIQKSTRQGSKPNFGVGAASSSDLQTSQTPSLWKASLEGSSANSCSNQGQQEQVAQSHVPSGFAYVQGLRSHSLSQHLF